jgi:hypothetical protein
LEEEEGTNLCFDFPENKHGLKAIITFMKANISCRIKQLMQKMDKFIQFFRSTLPISEIFCVPERYSCYRFINLISLKMSKEIHGALRTAEKVTILRIN